MAKIYCSVTDEFISNLMRTLGVHTTTHVVQEAMTLLNWAVEERQRGRVILSAKPDGSDVARLAMRSLVHIEKDRTR